MRPLKILLFYFFSCLSFSLYSQKNTKDISLVTLLPQLEKEHDIQFNYLESNVQKQVFFNSDLSFTNLLTSLEKQTQLRFEIIDNSQVIIRKFRATDLVSICGYIVGYDGEIEVVDEFNNKVVYSNDEGYFEFKSINYGSTILFKNNKSIVRSIAVKEILKTECPQLKINPFVEELEEVIINSYLTRGITKEGQVIQIQPNKFTMLPGIIEPDVMKSLEHIPSVQSPFEMASELYVRGSTPDQNLILWNGIKSYNPSHFFGLISGFNPYVIEEINFYDKGIQAKYGDRLASVIDIKSTQKVHNEFSGGAGINLINGDAFFNVPILKDKLSFTIAARRSYNDFIETPAYTPMAARVFQNTRLNEGGEMGNNDFYFLDYNIGVQGQLTKKDALQFNALYSQNDLVFKNKTEDDNYSDDLLTKNEGYSLQWQHQYSDELTQSTTLSLSNYGLDYLFESIKSGEKSNETRKNFVSDYEAKIFFDLHLNPRTFLQFGYQYSNNNIRYEIKNATDNFSLTLGEEDDSLQTHSLFTEYELSFKNKTKLQLGLRSNKYSISNKLFLEPRLYIETALFTNFTLNNAITFTSQAVTQIDESIINGLTLERSLWRITDKDFDILTSHQYSLGSTYKNKGWLIETDSYYKRTKNITTLTTGFLNTLNNDFSVGENKTFGVELFVKKKFKNYNSWISYSFANQKTKFDLINNNDFFISNLNIEHTFKWQHYYKLNNFQFSLGWLWHSGIATSNVETEKEVGMPVVLLFDNLNNANLAVYHRLDFSVLYNFKQKEEKSIRYQLGLSVQNLYDNQSIINREFVTTPGLDNEVEIIDYNSLGFTPNLSLRVFW